MTNAMKISTQTLDAILGLQFRVAWAGEALCDPPRLRWWRTDLVDPMSGGDFLQRLAPRTSRTFPPARNAAVASTRNGGCQRIPSGTPFRVTRARSATVPRSSCATVPAAGAASRVKRVR